MELDLPIFEPGWVWLAGAGPGDPGLLSLHALNGLRQADVVVHDALVSPEVLSLVRPGAVLRHAGKRGGKPSPKQRDISALLVTLAREGKRVLRLKGGDPLVFGRGGEEARSLVAAGIPFRIIPGISSGVGALAYAGIPTTDRYTNSSVTFLTGYGVGGGIAEDIDWDGLARSGAALVIFMAMSRIDQIADRLIKGGRSPQEPVAVICKATTPEQRVVETTLANAHRDVTAARLEPPALIVVGEVVRLRAALDWYGALTEGKVLDPDPLGVDSHAAASLA
ncbi:MAG: uroporphyrinogen-III C-methyltransferase [Alphaproteobacteria bacterium]|nr:MAG: uroporphyrinogen-III C-methyltransferase [Alphaproteobacteria bacterium]